jgi:peptidyl-tRNA hydrolase
VLHRPLAAEAELIHEAVLAGADAVPVMLTDGAQKAMNRLHGRGAAGPTPCPPA